jgi:glycerol-3-phosphate acyltransferase PlsX
MLLDAGANIAPKPEHLCQYAVMASDYMKYVYGQENPKVGLLNIGEEESKGTGVLKEAHALIEKSKVNFVGNIEARDIFTGKTQVVVCDGLVGNTVLKVTEGFSKALAEFLKRELKKSFLSRLGAFLSLPAYKALRKKVDYREYGGAPLLGVNGAVIISHGSSNAKAINSAVRAAGEYVKKQVNTHIVEDLQKISGGE